MNVASGVPASPWKAALYFEDPLHTAMPKIHRLAIHHLAASDQTVDVMSVALNYGLFGYTPLPDRRLHRSAEVLSRQAGLRVRRYAIGFALLALLRYSEHQPVRAVSVLDRHVRG